MAIQLTDEQLRRGRDEVIRLQSRIRSIITNLKELEETRARIERRND